MLEWQQHFSHCKSLVITPVAQRLLTPQSQVRAMGNSNSSWPSFYGCPHQKWKRYRVVTTLNINFQTLKCSKLRSRWWGGAQIQTHPSLIGCSCYLQSIQKWRRECSQHLSHYKSMGVFPGVQEQLTPQTLVCMILPNFEPIQDFIAVLATCKNEDDSIKSEGARVLTTLYIDFLDAQGQLTK